MNDEQLAQVAELWTNGNSLDAGRIVYEDLPVELRPKWASRILKVVLDRSGVGSPLFDELLDVADDKDLWGRGHQMFSAFRGCVLKLNDAARCRDLSEAEETFASVCALAELVSKVIYNATMPDDEFDEDSGWWVGAGLRELVDEWHDERFSQEAWHALSAPLEP